MFIDYISNNNFLLIQKNPKIIFYLKINLRQGLVTCKKIFYVDKSERFLI
jgi:hypothetical protein